MSWRGIVGVGVAGVLASAMVALLWSPRVRVTKSNFDKIPVHATKSDVRRALGEPENGIWQNEGMVVWPLTPDLPPGGVEVAWGGYEGFAVFQFDENEKVLCRAWRGTNRAWHVKVWGWICSLWP